MGEEWGHMRGWMVPYTHIKVIQYARVNLPRELIKELLQQFDIDEHGRSIRQFVRNDSQERLGTEGGLRWALLASPRADGLGAELEQRQAV